MLISILLLCAVCIMNIEHLSNKVIGFPITKYVRTYVLTYPFNPYRIVGRYLSARRAPNSASKASTEYQHLVLAICASSNEIFKIKMNDQIPPIRTCIDSIKEIGFDRFDQGTAAHSKLFTLCIAFSFHLSHDG